VTTPPDLPLQLDITAEHAWGGSTGEGVRVAIIDSGIQADHIALDHCVDGGVEVLLSDGKARIEPVAKVIDDFGHGTACAGIIHRIAPEAHLFSVKVLGAANFGQGDAFLAGLRWAIENRMDVVNMSLGTTNRRYLGAFSELVDLAYYHGCLLVAAANNHPPPSLPSIMSSLIAVNCREFDDPLEFTFHPGRIIEIDAHGVDVNCPWLDDSFRRLTGTSFATPHVTGLVARLRAKHPDLTPFQVKTVLCAIGSRNRELAAGRPGRRLGVRAVRARRRAAAGAAGERGPGYSG